MIRLSYTSLYLNTGTDGRSLPVLYHVIVVYKPGARTNSKNEVIFIECSPLESGGESSLFF